MKKYIEIIAVVVAAIIMLQTLYFKFTAQPESVYIFTTLGLEPYGRIGSGIAELIASLLLLAPKTRIYGAILGLGVISGAILSHLTQLGIVVQNDGGQLFIMAILVFFSCAIIAWFNRANIPFIGNILANI